ncbi:hypothetical protein ACT7CX_29305 [Bacillus cereus]
MTLGYKLKEREKTKLVSENMLPKKLVLQILFFSNYERDYRDPDTTTLES